jgi:hypothetical protein
MIADSHSPYCSISHSFLHQKQLLVDNEYTIFILVTFTMSSYAESKKIHDPP